MTNLLPIQCSLNRLGELRVREGGEGSELLESSLARAILEAFTGSRTEGLLYLASLD